jgi:signal transduction histidine kinase
VPAFGRAEALALDGKELRIMLVKNPAGATEGVRNAFKHADGSVTLQIAAADGQVVLQVLDSGRSAREGEPRGTGVGLRLLGQEVDRYGGHVEFRRLPEGSRFELRLPLAAGVGA